MARKTIGISADDAFIRLIDTHVEELNANQRLGVFATRSSFVRAAVAAAIKAGSSLSSDTPNHVRTRVRTTP